MGNGNRVNHLNQRVCGYGNAWLVIGVLMLNNMNQIKPVASVCVEDRVHLVTRDVKSVNITCKKGTVSVTRPVNSYCYNTHSASTSGALPPALTGGFGSMGFLGESNKINWKADTCDGMSETEHGATGVCFKTEWKDGSSAPDSFYLCCCRGYKDCNDGNRVVPFTVPALDLSNKSSPMRWNEINITAKALRTCVLNDLATPYIVKLDIAVCSIRDEKLDKDNDQCMLVYDQGKWTFGCAFDFPEERQLRGLCKNTTGNEWSVKGDFNCTKLLCCCSEKLCDPSKNGPNLDELVAHDIGTCRQNCNTFPTMAEPTSTEGMTVADVETTTLADGPGNITDTTKSVTPIVGQVECKTQKCDTECKNSGIPVSVVVVLSVLLVISIGISLGLGYKMFKLIKVK